MSSESARFVGSIPETYDTGLGPIIFAGYAADIARRVAAHEPARVLETAAGTGVVTRRLRDVLPAGARLTATDLNEPMLTIARGKFGPAETVEFQQADATALPFADRSFEAVVCQFGLMFFPDKDKAQREVRRVLVPGGRYLFNVWDSFRYNPFAQIAQEVAERFFPVDPPQFYKVPVSCAAIDPIKEALIEAGFSDIAVSVVRTQREIPNSTAFARALVYGNPLIDQIRSRGGAAPDDVVDTIAQRLRRAFGDDPGRMPLQAMVFSAQA